MKIYVAIAKNKKGIHGKLLDEYVISPRCSLGQVFREAGENGISFSTFDVAMFDLKKLKPTKIYKSEKSGYKCPLSEEK